MLTRDQVQSAHRRTNRQSPKRGTDDPPDWEIIRNYLVGLFVFVGLLIGLWKMMALTWHLFF